MLKTRIGVIGTGYMGGLHAQKYSSMENVKLVGVVDINLFRASEIATKFNTLFYNDHEELFGKVDAVSVATPTNTHFEIVRACLLQNIHVLVEKPITNSIQDADELIKISDNNHLILQVGHIEQFNPTLVSIKNRIDNPFFFESHRISNFKNRSAGTSVIVDLMIHDLEIVLGFINANIIKIHATEISLISNTLDTANAYLIFSNGAKAALTATRLACKNQRKVIFFQKNTHISLGLMNCKAEITRTNKHNKVIEQLKIIKKDQLSEQLKSFIYSFRTMKNPIVTGGVR